MTSKFNFNNIDSTEGGDTYMIPQGKVENLKTLREWRAYKRLSKAEIAKALGVHPSTYGRMENRPADVSVREANQLAEIFECEVAQINFFE